MIRLLFSALSGLVVAAIASDNGAPDAMVGVIFVGVAALVWFWLAVARYLDWKDSKR